MNTTSSPIRRVANGYTNLVETFTISGLKIHSSEYLAASFLTSVLLASRSEMGMARSITRPCEATRRFSGHHFLSAVGLLRRRFHPVPPYRPGGNPSIFDEAVHPVRVFPASQCLVERRGLHVVHPAGQALHKRRRSATDRAQQSLRIVLGTLYPAHDLLV